MNYPNCNHDCATCAETNSCPVCNVKPMPPLMPCPPVPFPPVDGCGCDKGTEFYNLPLWKASTVTSWLQQMNGAMIRIDSILHNLALRTGINGLPDDVVNCVQKLAQDMAEVQCTVSQLTNEGANTKLLLQNTQTAMGSVQTDISTLQLSVTNLDTRLMTIASSQDNVKNSINIVKSDLTMLASTVKSLSGNVTQWQDSVNNALTSMQNQINDTLDLIASEKNITFAQFIYFMSLQTGNGRVLYDPTRLTLSDTAKGHFALEATQSTTMRCKLSKLNTNVALCNILFPDKVELTATTPTTFWSMYLDISDANVKANGYGSQETIITGILKNTSKSIVSMIPILCVPYEEDGYVKSIRFTFNPNSVEPIEIAKNDVLEIVQFTCQFLFNYSDTATAGEEV